MLRITRIGDGESAILKLEGQFLQPWVEEVILTCLQADHSTHPPRLDLSNLTYADSAGVATLKDLQKRGCRIIACSGFVAALLQLEMP